MLAGVEQRQPRLLFCSSHCYVDSSSGAAQCTRDLLALLAMRGWTCGELCGSHRDCAHDASVDQVLGAHSILFSVQQLVSAGKPSSLYQFVEDGGVVTLLDMQDSRPPAPPTPEEGKMFLSLLDGILDQFRPDVVLTYGGNWLAWEIIARNKQRGVPVAFALHNFAYQDAESITARQALAKSALARRIVNIVASTFAATSMVSRRNVERTFASVPTWCV